jgi:uncharacterized protein YxeA
MKLKIVIGIVVVVVLAVVGVLLLTGGDDNDDTSTTAKNGSSKSDDKSSASKSDSSSDSDSGDEPALRTVEVNRASGKDAAVNVGALMRKPGKVYLRVSAAPKQKVTVNWTLACGVGATGQGDYEATPPDTRQLELPKKNPKTCVASASTQLDGNGRVKLAVMTNR